MLAYSSVEASTRSTSYSLPLESHYPGIAGTGSAGDQHLAGADVGQGLQSRPHRGGVGVVGNRSRRLAVKGKRECAGSRGGRDGDALSFVAGEVVPNCAD